MKKVLVLAILLQLIQLAVYAQTHVNKEWETTTGNPMRLEWASQITNAANQLFFYLFPFHA